MFNLSPEQEQCTQDFLNNVVSREEKDILKSLDSGVIVEPMEPLDFSISSNPFHHDLFHMGTDVNEILLIMFGSSFDYIILVNKKTGERIKLKFTGNWA